MAFHPALHPSRVRRLRVALAFASCLGCGDSLGGNNGGPPRLREYLDVDLSQMTTMVYVKSAAAEQSGSVGELGTQHGQTLREGNEGLFVFDSDGEPIEIQLLEGDSSHVGVYNIYPTADWIFLATWGAMVTLPEDPDTTTQCPTIAIRRDDGRIFCSTIATAVVMDNSVSPVQQNLAGTMGVLSSRDSVGNAILYRIAFDPDAGPTAYLIDEYVHPRLFALNAVGDAFVTHQPSLVDQTLASLIYPDATLPTRAISGTNNSFVSSGDPGSNEENTFFVANGGNGQNFDGVLRRVSKTADGFVEEEVALNLPNAGSFGNLLRLADGIYMINFTDALLARVVESGEIVVNPMQIPIVGIDEIVSTSALGTDFIGHGVLTILARSGSSYLFVRHDGQSQVNLAIPDELALQRLSIARSGAIDFIARDLTTNEYVRGRYAADSTQLVVSGASDLLRPEDVVAFTALN